VTVADAVELGLDCAAAVIVTAAGLGTLFGAMKSPVSGSIVPPVAVQLTFWFVEPLTVAEYCQFAPIPIVAGGAPVIATVTCWPPPPPLLDGLPHPANERRPNTTNTRQRT
jgi:hypothetical protein